MSFPPYPRYRQSGTKWLGNVPEHWQLKRFKQVLRERDDRSPTGEEELLSVSAYTGIRPRREGIAEGEHLSRAESLEGYKRCFPDDLVMNIMLAWNRGLGFSQHRGIVSPAYCVFQVVDGSNPRFLDYLLRSDEYIGYFKSYSAGVIDSRLRLYPDAFLALQTTVPPLQEQIAIAAFLDRETAKIDALVGEQLRLLELLKEKRQAVISHAVAKGLDPTVPMKDSGVEWLGEVPAHWNVAPLRYVARVQTGVAKGKDLEGRIARTVPYLRVANVQDGHIDLTDVAEIEIAEHDLSRYLLRRGDVLMNEGGDFDKLGRGDIWQGQIDPCIHQNHVFAVRPTGVSAEWLNLVTSSSYAQQYFITRSKQSTNLASISSRNVMNLPVVLPPPSEQSNLVERVGEIVLTLAEMREAAEGAVKLLQERRAALISATVTGKIDVRGAAIQRAEAA